MRVRIKLCRVSLVNPKQGALAAPPSLQYEKHSNFYDTKRCNLNALHGKWLHALD